MRNEGMEGWSFLFHREFSPWFFFFLSSRYGCVMMISEK